MKNLNLWDAPFGIVVAQDCLADEEPDLLEEHRLFEYEIEAGGSWIVDEAMQG